MSEETLRLQRTVAQMQAARDVAGYVSEVAAKPGQDTGALATAVQTVSQKPVNEQNGLLQIDADCSVLPDGGVSDDGRRAYSRPV